MIKFWSLPIRASVGTFFLILGCCLNVACVAVEAPKLTGSWEQGGIIFGKVPPGYKVQLSGEDIQVSGQGDFVIGFGRDVSKPASLTVTTKNGQSKTYEYPIKKRQYNIQRIEGVDKKHVTPPEEVKQRIAAESKKVRQARARVDQRLDFLEPFIWPLVGPITGVYGSQRVYNGVPKWPHFGIDIAAPTGTNVVAPAPGIVTLAEPDLYYSGGTLIIDHGYGLSSTFIHLSKVKARVGERVESGQVVAEVGSTGRSTGPHLDWRMNWLKERVDPGLLMRNKPMPTKK